MSYAVTVETCEPLDGSFEEIGQDTDSCTKDSEQLDASETLDIQEEVVSPTEETTGNISDSNSGLNESIPSTAGSLAKALHCSVCTKKIIKFHTKRHLRKHGQHLHCSLCPAKFTEKWSLDDHEQRHNHPFICDSCGKHFLSRFGLRRHAKAHEGKKPFECEVCNKTFFTKAHFEGHRNRNHLGYKPFKCEKCDKGFAYKTSSDRHIRDCKRDECTTCPSLFRSKRALTEHHKAKHEPTQHICNCGKVFKWLRSYNRHIKRCAQI